MNMGLNRRFSVGILTVLLIIALQVILVHMPEEVSAYTPHDPIYINGNGDFTPANGVTGGSGTPSDPYIIEGWEIDASSADGIEIRNTDAHFVIRSVFVHSGGTTHDGIYLPDVANGAVENATVSHNEVGIFLGDSTNTTITANNVSSNALEGIFLHYSTNTTITANNVSNNLEGIYLDHPTNTTITANNVSNNGWGIRFDHPTNTTITANNVSNNGLGIRFDYSTNTTITANNVSNNGRNGIDLHYSTNTTITANNFTSDGVFLWGDSLPHYNTHTITADNLVNDKPLYYYKDCNGLAIDSIPVGQLLLANCTNVTAANLTITNTDIGIEMAYMNGVTITANNVSNNWDGIDLHYSTNTTITANNVCNNVWGIYIYYSTNTTITANNVSSNKGYGILLYYSTNTTITANNVSNNGSGIRLSHSTNTTITANNVSNNDRDGILLDYSTNTTITANNVSNNDRDGIRLSDSTNTTITANNVSSNGGDGIDLQYSTNVTITASKVSSNNLYGIQILHSTSILVYHNNIISNTTQAYDNMGPENSWDNGYPSGGNYWSDYTGVDQFSGPLQDQTGSDGIGDTPHIIDLDSLDMYPLMFPAGIVFPRPPTSLRATLSGRGLENVTITWSLSEDDGAGLKSVVGYEIYRNTTYNPKGVGYGLVASLPNGTISFSDTYAGEGDPSIYFYQVCAVDLTNNTTCAQNQVAKFTRPLAQGPNLVSIPLIQSNESIEHVLQTVKFDKAWHYDSSPQEWKWYMKSKGYRRGLWNVNHTVGIWVNVTQDSNLTVAGVVPVQTTIHLHEGWDLVSFPSFSTTYMVADLKAETGATRVEGYDLAPPHHLSVLGDGEVLQAGEAYWVRVLADTDWIVEVS